MILNSDQTKIAHYVIVRIHANRMRASLSSSNIIIVGKNANIFHDYRLGQFILGREPLTSKNELQ